MGSQGLCSGQSALRPTTTRCCRRLENAVILGHGPRMTAAARFAERRKSLILQGFSNRSGGALATCFEDVGEGREGLNL